MTDPVTFDLIDDSSSLERAKTTPDEIAREAKKQGIERVEWL